MNVMFCLRCVEQRMEHRHFSMKDRTNKSRGTVTLKSNPTESSEVLVKINPTESSRSADQTVLLTWQLVERSFSKRKTFPNYFLFCHPGHSTEFWNPENPMNGSWTIQDRFNIGGNIQIFLFFCNLNKNLTWIPWKKNMDLCERARSVVMIPWCIITSIHVNECLSSILSTKSNKRPTIPKVSSNLQKHDVIRSHSVLHLDQTTRHRTPSTRRVFILTHSSNFVKCCSLLQRIKRNLGGEE